MIQEEPGPIPRKRRKPRKVNGWCSAGHPREKLYGAAKSKRRAEIFERASGRCEEMKVYRSEFGISLTPLRCTNRATEWSHNKHGANKCDHKDCGIASCQSCHERRHRPKAIIGAGQRDFKKVS